MIKLQTVGFSPVFNTLKLSCTSIGISQRCDEVCIISIFKQMIACGYLSQVSSVNNIARRSNLCRKTYSSLAGYCQVSS